MGARQAEVLQDLVQNDHGEHAGEHAEDQHEAHHARAQLEAETGEGVGHAEHDERLHHGNKQRNEEGVFIPLGKIGFPQGDVVVKSPFVIQLRMDKQAVGKAGGVDAEGLNHDADKGDQPDYAHDNEDDIQNRVAEPVLGFHAHMLLDGVLRSIVIDLFHHWKSSSFLTEGSMR